MFLVCNFSDNWYFGGGNTDKCDFPPHPERLFSALANAFYNGEKNQWLDERHRAALKHLEKLSPPNIWHGKYLPPRTTPVNYVPVTCGDPSNENEKKAIAGRGRRRRLFSGVTVNPPVVAYEWADEKNSDVWAAIAEIAQGINYLGTAQSLIESIEISENYDTQKLLFLRPDITGERQLRVMYPDLLTDLDTIHKNGGNGHPPPSVVSYTEKPKKKRLADRARIFHKVLCYKLWTEEGIKIPQATVGIVTHSLRGTLMAIQDNMNIKAPDIATSYGHTSAVAFMPLCKLNPNLPGSIEGIMVGLRESETEDKTVQVLSEFEKQGFFVKYDEHTLKYRIAPVTETDPIFLQPYRHQLMSREFVSLTPVEIDWPDESDWEHSILKMLYTAVDYRGLPEPRCIEFKEEPYLKCSYPAEDYVTRHQVKGLRNYYKVHVRVEFDEPVFGPVVIGAGHNFGTGFLVPAMIAMARRT